ncbi:MAG TPA: ribbon-helix-helix domain-containing protein [Vicinamibacteria bacterium]|nr:ribbon-helix-helix domain-containing protein [Vicinamibacteria bacterium]
MKTVQMTLDDELVREVDEVVERLGTTRSAFTRQALRRALEGIRIEALEEKHRRGYERHPVKTGEFDDWETEQVWPD